MLKIRTYIWKRKGFILTISIIFSILYVAQACFNQYYTEGMMISLIYPNSEKGKYPDGTRFNIYDLVSDEVLQNAVEAYNIEVPSKPISLNDVKNSILAEEYLTNDVSAKVAEARNMGLDYVYFANEFSVSCLPVYKERFSKKSEHFGLLPYVDNKIFIERLYISYLDYFMQEHAEKNIISGLTQNINYKDYDYIEMANIFEQRINMYVNYLETKNSENGAFYSQKTKMSFNDLINAFKNLKDVQVNNLTSFVSSSKLSKNPAEFINRLKVENEVNLLSYNKYKAESELSKKAMNQYDHTFEENIVITGISKESGLYQARPKTAYDTITKRTLTSGIKAENILKDIQENERLIKEYGSVKMQTSERERLGAIAEKLILEIEKENSELVKSANETVAEYLTQKSSDYVRRTMYGKNYFSLGILIKAGMVFAATGGFAVLALYTYEFSNRKRKMMKYQRANKKDTMKLEFESDVNQSTP